MSHFVAYILKFQEITVYKIPPGGRGSIASLRSIKFISSILGVTSQRFSWKLLVSFDVC